MKTLLWWIAIILLSPLLLLLIIPHFIYWSLKHDEVPEWWEL